MPLKSSKRIMQHWRIGLEIEKEIERITNNRIYEQAIQVLMREENYKNGFK